MITSRSDRGEGEREERGSERERERRIKGAYCCLFGVGNVVGVV